MTSIKNLEQIVEGNIIPSEAHEESIEQVAARIADIIVALHNTRHGYERELAQQQKIQEQVMKTKEEQERDAALIAKEIMKTSISVEVKKELWGKAEEVLKDLVDEKKLVHQLLAIIAQPEDRRRVELLKPIILDLLVKIRSTQHLLNQLDIRLRQAV